ncbi:MAG TPA: hypothetical protein DCW90_05850 [Lachnospiraceae bacterium]|nr:hypothetical protein [Lachnospiraceae bacterium]
MPGLSEVFYSSDTQTEKKSLSVPSEDYAFIRQVFPETGIPNYMTVYAWKSVVKRLHDLGIHSYEDRVKKKFSIEQLKELIDGRN